MAEYINRKDVLERICAEKCGNYGYEECAAPKRCLECQIIEDLPSADVAPVVHGKWIKRVNPQWTAHHHDSCSICGWWNTRNSLCYDGNRKPGHSLNYCPNCGARMDGTEENG